MRSAGLRVVPAAPAKFSSTLTLVGTRLSNADCVGITCGLAAVLLVLAVAGFGQPD